MKTTKTIGTARAVECYAGEVVPVKDKEYLYKVEEFNVQTQEWDNCGGDYIIGDIDQLDDIKECACWMFQESVFEEISSEQVFYIVDNRQYPIIKGRVTLMLN